jgi:hypothetical protein
MRYNDSATINPNQTTVGKAPEFTEQEDQTGMGDHAGLAPPQGTSTIVIDQFPIGSPGMPIPDQPQGSSVNESRRVASMDSPWAPFRSEVDWKTSASAISEESGSLEMSSESDVLSVIVTTIQTRELKEKC